MVSIKKDKIKFKWVTIYGNIKNSAVIGLYYCGNRLIGMILNQLRKVIKLDKKIYW